MLQGWLADAARGGAAELSHQVQTLHGALGWGCRRTGPPCRQQSLLAVTVSDRSPYPVTVRLLGDAREVTARFAPRCRTAGRNATSTKTPSRAILRRWADAGGRIGGWSVNKVITIGTR